MVFNKIDEDDFLAKIASKSTEENNENINTELKIETITEDQLSETQKNNIEKIAKWWENEKFVKPVEVVGGVAGSGKCLHENTLVITTKGLKAIKNLTLEDEVFGDNGKPCKISGIFPQSELKQCYKITFSDNTSFICDEEQILKYSSDNINFQEGTLKNILESSAPNIYFPINKVLSFSRDETNIATTLGVLLSPHCSDYAFQGMYFSIYTDGLIYNNNDLITILKRQLKVHGYEFVEVSRLRGVINFQETDADKANNFKQIVKELSNKQVIPERILFSNFITKKNFLEGFLATKTTNLNEININITSETLYKNIKFLIETIGGLSYDTVEYLNDNFTNATMQLIFNVNMSNAPTNKLIKKVANITKLSGEYKTVCIKVENNSSLYLIQDCIVVHNTTIIPHIINRLNLGHQVGHALHEDTGVLKKKALCL